LSGVTATTAITLWTLKQPKIYRATATVLINNRPPATLDKVPEVVTHDYGWDGDRFVNAQVRLLTSREMAERVAERLARPKDSLVGRIQVDVERSSQMAMLSVDDTNPAEAQLLANTFTQVYVEFTVSDRSNVTADAAHFLDDQTRTLRTRLEDDERALYEFQKTNELPGSNFEESHKIQSSTLSALHGQYSAARATGIHLQAEVAQIDEAQGDRALLRARALALADSSSRWYDLHQQHVTLLRELTQLETRYGNEHPKVIETRRALALVDQELDHELDTLLGSVRARVHANQAEQAQLRTAIGEETRKAIALRQNELEYNRLKRRIDQDRDAYELVAKRQKETELQALVKQTYLRPLDSALRPSVPIKPSLRQNVLVGILAGLLLGCALAVTLDMLDDTVRSPTDAEHMLPQPVLGVLMSIPVPRPDLEPNAVEVARAEHVVKHPRSRVAEQCHCVATNMFSMFLEAPPRAIMVVSAAIEDGKTLACVNLASSVAARGKKVLLIDGDLRRGRLHRLFQLPRGGGLFELVTQRIAQDEAIRQTWIPNVDVITTGEVPDKVSPVRVFELKELEHVAERLKERYDLVIIDTAPVCLVADAQIIGGVVDGAVGVVRANKTSRRLARGVAQQLAMARVNLVGWVLNDISESDLRAGYYYKYGYGYYRYGWNGYYSESPPPSQA
jgi:capsular exopolysaccharide synthesis family protein